MTTIHLQKIVATAPYASLEIGAAVFHDHVGISNTSTDDYYLSDFTSYPPMMYILSPTTGEAKLSPEASAGDIAIHLFMILSYRITCRP